MLAKDHYKIIGLMSGTSGDGLDIAFCEFKKADNWQYSITRCETVAFPKDLGIKLKKSHQLNGYKLAVLDVEFGRWMGEKVADFCKQYNLFPEAVASHGHTVFHQPSKSLTLQIGNGWSLHQNCGFPVINDFRMLDVQLGGQGAPLVPIGDQKLFSEYDYCLNLGGIANISMQRGNKRIAFDICPFNLLLNHFANQAGKEYDKDGELAKKGEKIPEIYEELNKLAYYHHEGAKSLAREDLEYYLEILEKNKKHKPQDILRTLVEHYAFQIKNVIASSSKGEQKLLVTGGGAFNRFFMQELQKELAGSAQISEVDQELINFKEALVFAFLGLLKLRGEINCLASVTGASRDNCGGTVFGL